MTHDLQAALANGGKNFWPEFTPIFSTEGVGFGGGFCPQDAILWTCSYGDHWSRVPIAPIGTRVHFISLFYFLNKFYALHTHTILIKLDWIFRSGIWIGMEFDWHRRLGIRLAYSIFVEIQMADRVAFKMGFKMASGWNFLDFFYAHFFTCYKTGA